MDPCRVASELSGVLEGDVRTDDLSRELYSTAAGMYRETPLAVVEPVSRDDVVGTVRFAAREGVPVTPRGGGTSLAGQALGPGIVLDFSVGMNRVLDVDFDEGWVEVEPGVVEAELDETLEPEGFFFPVDPSSRGFCTVGGMLSNNASGAHSLMYGDTRSNALGIECVLSDGSVARTGSLGDDLGWIVDRLRERENRVRGDTPEVPKNSSGYDLRGALQACDATPLLVGSEGTLAVFTKARLRVERVPEDSSTLLLHFDSLDRAGDAVPELLDYRPSALELMGPTFLEVVKEKRPGLRGLIPAGSEAALLLDFHGSEEEVRASTRAASRSLRSSAVRALTAEDEEERRELWRVRESGLPLMQGAYAGKRAAPLLEDVVVPPEEVPNLVVELSAILDASGLEAAIYGHVGEGNLHPRPLVDPRDPGDREKLVELAEETFEVVAELGGSISGEHGDGYLRAPYLGEVYGPLLDVFRDVKEWMDPDGVLNPGKVLEAGPAPDVREVSRGGPQVRGEEQLESCHGCGRCRSVTERPCPFFEMDGTELSSPRGMVNAARALDRGRIGREEAAKALSKCFSCRSCTVSCSSDVDPSILPGSCLHTGLRERALSSYGLLGSFGRKLGVEPGDFPMANAFMGLSTERELPSFEGPHLDGVLPREPDGGNPVALFAGCHVRYFDPGPALALREILEACGHSLYLPEQVCCGLPLYSSGQYARACRAARKNVDRLPLDVPVVSTCPGCVLSLRKDYPESLGLDHGLEIYTAFELLATLDDRGDFVGPAGEAEGQFVLHEPCHSHALGPGSVKTFLERVTDLVGVEDGCCGMGGAFGFRSESYPVAMEIGGPLFESIEESGGTAVTECPGCELQLGHALGEAVHPLEVLAEGYG